MGGLNTAQSSLSTKSFVLSNVLFSLSSPLGVGLGMAVSDLPVSLPQDICNGVLQGIAGGTFLFITFFEVLPHELNVPGKRLVKVFFVILGFIPLRSPPIRLCPTQISRCIQLPTRQHPSCHPLNKREAEADASPDAYYGYAGYGHGYGYGYPHRYGYGRYYGYSGAYGYPYGRYGYGYGR